MRCQISVTATGISIMYADTEGVILKLTKAVNGRKMIVLFSKKFGKISAAGSGERGKGKSALALKPFTYGRYSLFTGREIYNINSAEVVKSYFGIGEDVEKYMCASFVLEFTEKLLPENIPNVELFKLIIDFFDMIEVRKKKHLTLLMAYQLKAIQLMGLQPGLDCCVKCGVENEPVFFDVMEGGIVCGECGKNMAETPCYYRTDFDIINALRFFFGNSLKSVERIALDDRIMAKLFVLVGGYRAYHLNISELKSEELLKNYLGG